MTDPDFIADLEADRRTGPPCTAGVMLARIAADDPALELQVRSALSGTYESSRIGRQLRKRGYHIEDSTLRRHRAGLCRCERP